MTESGDRTVSSKPLDPFTLMLDFRSGALEPHTSRTERHVSDMRGAYADATALEHLVKGGDPLVYEVLQYDIPEEVGQLICCTTVLHPGTVGDEYFMTKGHYHLVRDTGEVYLGLSRSRLSALDDRGGRQGGDPDGPGHCRLRAPQLGPPYREH